MQIMVWSGNTGKTLTGKWYRVLHGIKGIVGKDLAMMIHQISR